MKAYTYQSSSFIPVDERVRNGKVLNLRSFAGTSAAGGGDKEIFDPEIPHCADSPSKLIVFGMYI